MKKPFASWMAIVLAVLMPLHVFAAGRNGSGGGSSGALTVKSVAACSSGSCPPEAEPITKEGDDL